MEQAEEEHKTELANQGSPVKRRLVLTRVVGMLLQDVTDKVQQMQSKLSELTSQQETLRRDFQALSTTVQRAEVCLQICTPYLVKEPTPLLSGVRRWLKWLGSMLCISFTALTLLVGLQEAHPACRILCHLFRSGTMED